MKYAKLGHTDIEVSRICIGGMSFGAHSDDFYQWTLDPQASKEMIAHAYDMGVNFIDTANQYSHGTSEEYIGRAIKELHIPREKIVIATKVYYNEGHLSRKAILREIDGSLERLQTDYVDLYQLHRFDYDTPIEETMETLDELVKAGKVRAIGASAMYAYQFHNMMICAEKNGWTMFSTMQDQYNLLYREEEREMIPLLKQYGVSQIPYSPLAGGHLSHTGWTSSSTRSQSDQVIRRRYDSYKDNDLEIIDRVHDLADKYHVSMTQISLAWLYHKGVTAPIVGATKIPHFDDAVKAMDVTITDEDCQYLEELYLPHAINGNK